MDDTSKDANSQRAIPPDAGGLEPGQADSAVLDEAARETTVPDGVKEPPHAVDPASLESGTDEGISQADLQTLLRSVEADPPEAVGTGDSVWASAGERAAHASADPAGTVADLRPFDLPDLGSTDGKVLDAKRVSMLHDVDLHVKVELGRTRMLVEDVLKLGGGSVVELDKLAGDPVDVLVNDRLVARGEVLVLNDSFCVRISEVLSHDPHRIMA